MGRKRIYDFRGGHTLPYRHGSQYRTVSVPDEVARAPLNYLKGQKFQALDRGYPITVVLARHADGPYFCQPPRQWVTDATVFAFLLSQGEFPRERIILVDIRPVADFRQLRRLGLRSARKFLGTMHPVEQAKFIRRRPEEVYAWRHPENPWRYFSVVPSHPDLLNDIWLHSPALKRPDVRRILGLSGEPVSLFG